MSNLPQNLQPPPVKSPFLDGALVGWTWLKWFQNLITYLNAPILYTPTVTAGSGAFGSPAPTATGRYRQIGKLIFIQVTVTITTNGTAATNVQVTPPLPIINIAGVGYVLQGRADAVSGKGLYGRIEAAKQSGNITIVNDADGTYPGASGEVLVLSGFYEIA